jgi:rhamnogalacturonyl hydrolase YesR
MNATINWRWNSGVFNNGIYIYMLQQDDADDRWHDNKSTWQNTTIALLAPLNLNTQQPTRSEAKGEDEQIFI